MQTIKTTGRVSSKQVGEDLTNGFKDKMAAGSNKSSMSCHPNDRLQMWPLFCYELAVSLDQEEKLLQYLRRYVMTTVTIGLHNLDQYIHPSSF